MNMNGYYAQQYEAADSSRPMDTGGVVRQPPVNNMPYMGAGASDMDAGMMIGGQSLDDMVLQNNADLHLRRQSFQAQYPPSRLDQANGIRRASMTEFAANSSGELNDFQFDPVVSHSGAMGNGNGIMSGAHNNMDSTKRVSRGDLATLDTHFSSMGSGYGQIASAPVYQSSMDPNNSLRYDVQPYIPSTMGMSMDYMNSGMTQGTSGDVTPMNVYPQAFQNPLTQSPLNQSYSPSTRGQPQDPGGGRGNSDTMTEKMPNSGISDPLQSGQAPRRRSSTAVMDTPANGHMQDLNGLNQRIPISQADMSQRMDLGPDTYDDDEDMPLEMRMPENTPAPSQFPNAYSSSGFDMIKVLMEIGSRPKPEINIGAVDLSCAFVVCDLKQHDLPIVYCSDVFERLTGYSKHEILGRNCRFLQAPDGKVQAGVKRKYVDDSSVLLLKNRINKRTEVQVSLINYRKGGQPFMNLLTMIPIKWDTEEFRYYVGFQVDLVEQPNSVTNRNPDGTYTINYQRGMLPRYVLQTPEISTMQSDIGQTIGRDEVSTVLSTIGSGESELSKRIWDKVLLENTDDVVHVLSLKGLFLYLSPACRKVLEYEAGELVGTALSSVCHPSDIVPVTRELKDTSTGASINVVFRIRRKHSGYTWFESHGSLHTEQGKGRKCIILVGRERPVYALQRSDLVSAGGIGENELWSKMSTSGMFLYVSANSGKLLDRQPDELIGTSIQALMRADTKTDFDRILEVARTGKRASFKHEMQNRRGQVLQAQTIIFPGDAVEGSKPTFFVAQTRLLKLTRSLAPHRRDVAMSPRTDQASAGSATPSTQMSSASNARAASTPQSSQSTHFEPVLTTPGGSGLPIGNQDEALASEDNVFDELKTTRSTSWQFELRQMEKQNRLLSEELQGLLSRKKKRKRRKGTGQMEKDCANCHTRVTPEWRRGPSGNRDLCNSCGLRWAKLNGRVSPRKSSDHSDGKQTSVSPEHPDQSLSSSAVGSDPSNKTKIKDAQNPHQKHPSDSKVARLEHPHPPSQGGFANTAL